MVRGGSIQVIIPDNEKTTSGRLDGNELGRVRVGTFSI